MTNHNMPKNTDNNKPLYEAAKMEIIDEKKKIELLRDFYQAGVARPTILVVSDLEKAGWADPEVLKKIGEIDFEKGGFLLVDKNYNDPHLSEKQLYRIYTFETQLQINELLSRLEDIALDGEALLGAYSKKQAIDFGASIDDYTIKSNF